MNHVYVGLTLSSIAANSVVMKKNENRLVIRKPINRPNHQNFVQVSDRLEFLGRLSDSGSCIKKSEQLVNRRCKPGVKSEPNGPTSNKGNLNKRKNIENSRKDSKVTAMEEDWRLNFLTSIRLER